MENKERRWKDIDTVGVCAAEFVVKVCFLTWYTNEHLFFLRFTNPPNTTGGKSPLLCAEGCREVDPIPNLVCLFVLFFFFFLQFVLLEPLQNLGCVVGQDEVGSCTDESIHAFHDACLQIKDSCLGRMPDHRVLARDLVH